MKGSFRDEACEEAVVPCGPEFWREVQHPSALSLLDFPFLGAAFASSKYSGRRRRGRENPIFPWCARASQGVALRVRIHPRLLQIGITGLERDQIPVIERAR